MARVCDSYCKGCIYLGSLNSAIPWCKYVFMEDKLRPCPPGAGCTVRMTNKDIKRKAEEAKKAQAVERMKLSAEQQRLRAERKEAELLLKMKPCKNCGKIFLPSKDHRDHCSSECAYQYHLKTENERSKKRWAAMQAAKKKKKEEA